jgi:thiol-disulfide isomerase/thioredoxin
MRYLHILLLTIAIAAAACTGGETFKPPAEGEYAPDFTLNDLAGKPTTLSELKGSVVLLNFWATWCPPCREEIPSMAALNRIMSGKPFRMLTVSIDQGGREAAIDYFNRSGTSLPTLLDSEGKVGKKYGITGVPQTFVIDKNGVIIKKIIGPLNWSGPEALRLLNDAMK